MPYKGNASVFRSTHTRLLGILLGLLLVAGGLIAVVGRDAQPRQMGNIHGTVLLGPTCPVMRNPPDPTCADKPFRTRLALMTSDGSRTVQAFGSNENGAFSVSVPPGAYVIRSVPGTMLPRCSSNGTIHVGANENVKADVSCDTGIR